MNKIKKQYTLDRFGNELYLLGQDKDGYNVYLELPKWDCGWYWGFGYIETYTNKTDPTTAYDINSHSHWNYAIVGKIEGCSGYIYHINQNPDFISTVLSDKESWELAELMSRFYTLREAAEVFYRGGSHITNSTKYASCKWKEGYNMINQVMLPAVFKRIDKILRPRKRSIDR